jgi:hypothetical protein
VRLSLSPSPEPKTRHAAALAATRDDAHTHASCHASRIMHYTIPDGCPMSMSVRDGSDDLLDGLWEWEGHSKRPRAKAELQMHMPHLHMHMPHHSNKHLWPRLTFSLLTLLTSTSYLSYCSGRASKQWCFFLLLILYSYTTHHYSPKCMHTASKSTWLYSYIATTS